MKLIQLIGLSLLCCACGYIDQKKVSDDEKVIKDVIDNAITPESLQENAPIPPAIEIPLPEEPANV